MTDQTLQGIICPECGSDAVCRYGRTVTKKQRYICLNCSRQFSPWSKRGSIMDHPVCPVCKKRMHVYMKKKEYIRYRCAGYPECNSYVKIERETEKEKICETCAYWDPTCSSEPGIFGCCVCQEANLNVPPSWARRNFRLFEKVRYYTCDYWTSETEKPDLPVNPAPAFRKPCGVNGC